MIGRAYTLLGLGDLASVSPRLRYSFFSVIAMSFFLFGDQQLLAPNLSRIGADFGFVAEREYRWYIGALPALFFFPVGGLMALVIGVLSDIYDRRRMLVLAILLGEASCLATAFASDYLTFLVLRTLTGIGLGGFYPTLFSLIGDYFRAENRSAAAGWLETAMGLGVGAGQVLAGALANESYLEMPGWRWSFVIMAAPSFPLAILYFFLGQNPRRGGAERALEGLSVGEQNALLQKEAQHRLSFDDFRRIFRNRTNLLALAQGVPGMVPWGFFFVYMVDLYEKSKGFSVGDAVLLSLAFGGSSIFGGLIGGFIGRSIYNWRRGALPVFGALTITLGTLPGYIFVNYGGSDLTFLLGVAVAGGLVVSMAGVNIRAILINVNPPEIRSSVFAVFSLFDKIGAGFGPFIIGFILLGVGRETLAYNLAISCWLPCAAIWLLIAFTSGPDEDRVTAALKARAAISS